jgi:leader peptidase (prepilin peptidase)/N-methyltransferase
MASLILFPVGLIVGVIAEAVAIEAPLSGIRERSSRLALVAVATGLLFAATPLVVGVHWVLPAYLWFVAVTVTLTLTDFDSKLIPNRILFPGTAIALVLLYAGSLVEGGALLRPLLGGGAYYLLLLVLALVGPSGAMGGGDVKLGFLLGVFTAYPSWDVMMVSVLAAFLLGGLVSIVLIVTRVRDRKDAIAFGPYLIAGAYVGLAWGATIAEWYLGGG